MNRPERERLNEHDKPYQWGGTYLQPCAAQLILVCSSTRPCDDGYDIHSNNEFIDDFIANSLALAISHLSIVLDLKE